MSVLEFDCISDVLYDFLNSDFKGYYHDTENFKLLKKLLKSFIKVKDYSKKRVLAKKAVILLFKLRDKSEASFPFEILKKMEVQGTFYKEYRDHIIHTVYVFLLGYYFYKKNQVINTNINEMINKVKEEFSIKSGIRDVESDESNFIYMWSLISIYHDYGYVFENTKEKRKIEFFNSLIDFDYHCTNKDDFKLKKCFDNKAVVDYLKNLRINNSHVDGLELIGGISNTTRLSNSGCNGLQNYLNFCLEVDSGRPKYLDHGIISSLLFLKLSNIIFLERNRHNKNPFNWNQNIQDTYFKYIAQAIAVHNIYVNSFEQSEYVRYKLNLGDKVTKGNMYKVFFESDPYAYLLALCDDLQAWDRKKSAILHERQNELTNAQVRVQIEDSGIIHFYYLVEGVDTKIQTIEDLEDYLDNVSRFIKKTIIKKM